jgi:ATP-grasp domain, R2K clade family 3
MAQIQATDLDLIWLEECVWVLSQELGLPSYDFHFSSVFACRRPWQREQPIHAIGRFGVATNYETLHQELAQDQIFLLHSPEEHALLSELPRWYGLLQGLTPRSLWFETPPEFALLEAELGLPLFIKGARQTSRHRADFSIVHTQADYQVAVKAFLEDPILHWQQFVAREFVKLRPVPHKPSEKIPASFEFRSFWWRGHCVGAAPYWATNYSWTPSEQQTALALAREAAMRLQVPFVVIDIAQKQTGDWVVIECNDAQESGYAAISPISMWQQIIRLEQERFVS